MKVLIISQPKCGSTALYYRIKRALPEGASCWFEPTDLEALGEEMERLPVDDAVCKYLIQPWTGGFEAGLLELIPRFDRVLLLHRDPRDFLISSFLYSFYDSITAESPIGMAQALAVLERKERTPDTIDLLTLIRLKNRLELGDFITPDLDTIPTRLDRYGNRIDLGRHPLQFDSPGGEPRIRQLIADDESLEGFLSYVRRSCAALLELRKVLANRGAEVHWLAYEALVRDELDTAAAYLGASLSTSTGVDQEHRRVTRTKGSGDWRNWASPNDLLWLREEFGEYLETFNYPSDWQLPATPRLDPEFGSGYVFRLFQERHQSELELSREGLAALAAHLWIDPLPPPTLLPGFRSGKGAAIGSESASISDIRIEDMAGNPVNLLISGESYRYRYRADFTAPCEDVDFWMQINNRQGYSLRNGSSICGPSRPGRVGPSDSIEISFPFLCTLRHGVYFCNAGITHRIGDEVQVLHRQVDALAFIVHERPSPLAWLVPEVNRH